MPKDGWINDFFSNVDKDFLKREKGSENNEDSNADNVSGLESSEGHEKEIQKILKRRIFQAHSASEKDLESGEQRREDPLSSREITPRDRVDESPSRFMRSRKNRLLVMGRWAFIFVLVLGLYYWVSREGDFTDGLRSRFQESTKSPSDTVRLKAQEDHQITVRSQKPVQTVHEFTNDQEAGPTSVEVKPIRKRATVTGAEDPITEGDSEDERPPSSPNEGKEAELLKDETLSTESAGPATVGDTQGRQKARVTGIHHRVEKDLESIIINLDGPIKFRKYEIPERNIVYIALRKAHLSSGTIEQARQVSSNNVKAVYLGQFTKQVARLAIQLEEMMTVSVFSVTDPDRIVIVITDH